MGVPSLSLLSSSERSILKRKGYSPPRLSGRQGSGETQEAQLLFALSFLVSREVSDTGGTPQCGGMRTPGSVPSQRRSSEHRLGSQLDPLQLPAGPLTSYVALRMSLSPSLDLLIYKRAVVTEPPHPRGMDRIYREALRAVPGAQEGPQKVL